MARDTSQGAPGWLVGLLIVFPQMSLVYKSGAPDVDINKVKIEIPADEVPSDDIMKQLQGGKAPADQPSKEDQQADDLQKQFGGGKK